ncbi:DUF5977 domain-containing protein [Mucilaginibacter sp.]|uniref:DUF5977 domain-containing protein n=1 Tax=Mucilaginibacter sp. TaxID=1882438 RepID=UPI00326685BA
MRFRILCVVITAFISCLAGQKAASQSSPTNYIPTVFPKAPNVAAFEKYGDYPVDLSSGVPNISIPLYTIESGSLKVPITLSYHASGNRVDESASWVGLGWTVSTGGAVTRSVMGNPDEAGYLNGYKGLASLNSYTHNGLDSLYGIINNHLYDMRPDMFSYNFPGYSGKFFFNGKNSFKVNTIPYSPIVISGRPSSSFTILDEHGNKHLFGNTTRDTTTTHYTSGGLAEAVTSWMLEKMISQNRRDTVSFSYIRQYITPPDQTGETYTVEDNLAIFNPQCAPTNYLHNPTLSITDVSASVAEHDISQIDFKNGKVEFKLGHRRTDDMSNALTLDTIKVSQYSFATRAYEVQKSIVFFKTYFPMVGGGDGRLRLDSIEVLDKAGSIAQHYRFTYDSLALPSQLSFSKDLWGYYNGKTNTTLIPRMQIEMSTGGGTSYTYIGASTFGTRDPDTVKMQAGILKRIDYPTGGHTDFAYQTNRYFDTGGTMHLTGGLRVTSISSYASETSVPIVKSYQYNSSRANFTTDAAGQLNYGIFSNSILHRFWKITQSVGGFSLCAEKRVRSYTSDPGIALTPSEGCPVYYSNVTEYVGTPASNIGKTVYVYNVTPDQTQTASYTGIPVIYNYSAFRNRLLYKTEYKKNSDNTYQKVRQTANTYSAFGETRYDAVGVAVGQWVQNEGDLSIIYYDMGTPNDALNTFPASNYAILSDDNYVTSTTTQVYDTADTTKMMASTVDYKYGNIKHQQVTRIRQADSKGNTLVSVTKYPADYLPTSSSTSTANILLDSMLNRNMQAEAIEKWDSVKNVTTAINAVTGGQLSSYQTGQISGTIVPYKISRLKVTNPLTDFTPSTVTSGNIVADSRYVKMIQFDAYDSRNNILQYTPRTQTPTNIVWDHNYELPIAQIKNVDNSIATNAAYTSFEADQKGNWSFSGPTQYDVTAPTGRRSYSLAGGTVTSPYFTNTKSFVLSLWAKGTAPTVSYAATYPAAVSLRSANGWTYYEYKLPVGSTQAIVSGTAIVDELRLYPADAQMTTYTYGTDGLIQMTDTKSQISRFEYDFASRLKNIKDWNGNIVKNYGYHTYDMVVGNDAQTAKTYTRNNCPVNTTPGTFSYSIPANKYVSSTKASANALAVYDQNTNGQIQANDPQNCGCPVQMVNFTITNSTGINTFHIAFSGPASYDFYPTTSSTTVSVQAGTYSIQIFPTGTFANHTYRVGSRSPVTAPGTTFTGVSIMAASNESPLTIQ